MTKRNICMISEEVKFQYTQDLAAGIRDQMMGEGYSLIHFPLFVSELTLENVQSYYCHAARAALALNAEAYILPVGIMGARFPEHKEHIAKMLEILKDRTVFILEDEMEGYECLSKDNAQGIRDLVVHLLDEHGYQKAVMLAGPASSHGSGLREAVYREEMEKRGFEQAVYRGSFTGDSDEVVKQLIAEHPDAEAIVCANDHLALCVYRVLNELGIRPGEDIAVTGFDDLPRSSLMSPPLSMVALPAYSYGRCAGAELIHILKHEEREVSVFPSRFIQRESCGHREDKEMTPLFATWLKDRDAAVTGDELYGICASVDDQIYRSIVRKIIQSFTDIVEEKSVDIQPAFEEIFNHAPDLYFRKDLFFRETDALIRCMVRMFHSADLEHIRTVFNACYARYVYNASREIQIRNMNRTRDIQRISVQGAMYEDNDYQVWTNAFNLIRKAGFENAALYLFDEEHVLHKCAVLNDTDLQVYDDDDGEEVFSNLWENPVSHTYVASILENGEDIMGLFLAAHEERDPQPVFSVSLELATTVRHLRMHHYQKRINQLLQDHNISLHHQAEYDSMTGLLNRRGFIAHAEERKKEHSGEEVTVFYMDLDRLKYINDTFGHHEGDFALNKTAELLNRIFRHGDLISRFGGDEYCALARCSRTDAAILLHRIDSMFASYNARHEKQYHVSISVGCVTVPLMMNTDLDAVLSRADERLYEVKKARRTLRTE